MKKRFIFSLLAIFLAGLWFGGISLAATITPVNCDDESAVAQIWELCYSSLVDAVAEVPTNWTESTTITLKKNATAGGTLAINWWKNIILDLKTYTLNNDVFLYVLNGKLKIINGTIIGERLDVYGGTTADVPDNYSYLEIWEDVVIDTNDFGIVIFPLDNTAGISYWVTVNVNWKLEKSIFVSWNIKVWNTTINVNWEVVSPDIWIAQNGYSIVNIYDWASITADETALEVRAWVTHINWWTFVSNWDPASVNSNWNGTTTVWAALAVSQHTTVLPIDVTVEWWTFNGVNALIITNPEWNDIYDDWHEVEVAVNGWTFNGNIVSENQKDGADPLEWFIAGWTFNNPIKKIHISDETKCTIKTSAWMYEIWACPVSIIRHDFDSDLEWTSPEATITVNGYNATVSWPINFYNKALNQWGWNRYGLEIVSEWFESTLIWDATYTLNWAHWNNVAWDYELWEFWHDYSWFAYPKLTEDNKSNPLTITINWWDYYPIETFTITHGDVELRWITVTFDTDWGTEISDKVFSWSDFDSLPANIKVWDIAIPEKVWYTFANWYLSWDDATSVYDTNSVIEHDITLKANYTPNDVTMTFIVDGESTELAWKVWDTYDKPVPTKSCYTARWTPVLPDVMPTENTTYTLSWSYSCGGGGSSSSSSSSSNKIWDNNTWATAETWTTNTWADTPTEDPQAVAANGYTNEMNEAYEFAYANGITTMKSIDEAEMFDGLTRIAMAKMLSQYAINVLGKSPADVEVPNFTDVSADLDAEYANGVSLAYKLWIMWINMPDNKFLPYETVTRAQFGTALSRLLFGIEDGEYAYYTTHLAKLKEAWIITNDDPTLEELRGYVMLMLMRSAK